MAFWQRLWQQLRGAFARRSATPTPRPALHLEDDAPEPEVPEISVQELQQSLLQPAPPLLIDVREPYEWRLVRMPTARHLPVNDIPAQLATLPRNQKLVIVCAHGSRSYSVAAWLNEQGFDAISLAGGISEWARQGGVMAQGADDHAG